MTKRKKKILLFIKTPPPVTGATLMNQRVYESDLLRDEFQVRSITISYAKNVRDLGKISLRKIIVLFATIVKLFKELVLHRPTFVYFQLSPTGYAFYRDLIYIVIIKLFRIKILFHLHGKGIKQAVKNSFHHFFYTFAFQNSEIICLSNLLTYDIEDVFDGKIHIVNNGILDEEECVEKDISNSAITIINVLFLSNLIKAKGVFDFLTALEILKKRNVPFKATIVGGEGDLMSNELVNLLNRKGLDEYVTYAGPKYGDDKKDAYMKCDAVVFPTKLKHETFGNVNLEAMMYGKPLISTKVGAIPDIIDDGKTGFLVDVNSPAQIADKIEYMIHNPDKTKKMGKRAREKFLLRFTQKRFEENLTNVFKKV